MITRLCCSSLALILFISGCTDTEPSGESVPESNGLQKVTLMLNWRPEAEHGGYYAALVHGYFEEEGLHVEILPGGPGAPVIQKVARGDVTFGITNADDVLLARAQEADIVAVMAPLQTSPRCIMVHKSSGITSFDELKNVKLAMSGSKAFAQYLKKNLPLEGVELQENPSVARFLVDENYAQQGYVFSEPFVAEQEGGDPVSLLVSDIGFNPYTSLLMATSETITQQPELVQKMVRASIKGWAKYLDEPIETNEHIHNLNSEEMSMEILAYGVESMKPLCVLSEAKGTLGMMTVDRWLTLHQQMLEIEAIEPDVVEPELAFTLKFLTVTPEEQVAK